MAGIATVCRCFLIISLCTGTGSSRGKYINVQPTAPCKQTAAGICVLAAVTGRPSHKCHQNGERLCTWCCAHACADDQSHNLIATSSTGSASRHQERLICNRTGSNHASSTLIGLSCHGQGRCSCAGSDPGTVPRHRVLCHSGLPGAAACNSSLSSTSSRKG